MSCSSQKWFAWSFVFCGHHMFSLTDFVFVRRSCFLFQCATVDTWAGVVIGIVAGWVYLLGSKLLIRFRIDDAVDAIPVHCVGGAWGVIAAGLFTKGDLLEAAYGQSDHIGWCKYNEKKMLQW